ncbi:MAG: sulfur carrier protein ThiS [Prevotella sp.]|nr:sulfur carrier protein ThiS [Prevotella sp.]
MAKIIVNGEAHEYTLPLNIKELITQALVESPEMVSVQLNEEFVEREVWALTQLQDGDQVDFLYFMGGGQKD